MKLKLLLIAVATFTLSMQMGDKTHQLCEGIIAPELTVNYVPPAHPVDNGVDEAMFDKILDRIEEVYTPIFKESFESDLKVYRNWESETMNAYASRSGNDWEIQMFGGWARHPKGSPGHFLATACHEIGHHIGGAPKKGARWASDEGQSDYYATLKCIRKVLDGWDLGVVVEVNPIAEEACLAAYDSSFEIEQCGQMAMMGHDIAMVLGSFSDVTPDFDTPSDVEVETTMSRHPPAQCRHDIYFNGAICNMEFNKELPQDDPRVGACWTDEGQDIGTRRRCWFQPNTYSL